MLAVIVALLLRESCKTIDLTCDSIVQSIKSMTQLYYSIALIMRVPCSTAPSACAAFCNTGVANVCQTVTLTTTAL